MYMYHACDRTSRVKQTQPVLIKTTHPQKAPPQFAGKEMTIFNYIQNHVKFYKTHSLL